MEITVTEQKVFLIEARLSPEQVRERAWDQKLAAFGSLSRLLLRPKGDEIKVASVEKRYVHLLYHPVYAFEYAWEAHGKKAVVEIDAVSGDLRTDGRAIHQQMRRIFNRDVLFDLGAETINLVVPGGAIALKLGKAIVDHQRGPKSR